MARPIEQKLYKVLIDSKFSFINKGIHNIVDIYRAVQAQHPSLCDNTYYCADNCSHGNNQPEWNHTVRNALQTLQSPKGPVHYTGNRGFWKVL